MNTSSLYVIVPDATKLPPWYPFEANTFPRTWRGAAPRVGAVLIPTCPEIDVTLTLVPFAVGTYSKETPRDPVFKVEIFALVVKFMVPDTSTLVVKRAFETQTFPRTLTFAPERPIEF